jgi:hypothetical protein
LHHDRHAAGAHRVARLWLRRGGGVQLRAEKVDPKIPVLWDPQESSSEKARGTR